MPAVPAIWVDGQRENALPLPDRGLDFGDGLFETLLWEDGTLRFPELHWQRLQRGLLALKFPPCEAQIRRHFDAVIPQLATLDCERGSVRLTVTRGAGPRGYAPPAGAVPRSIVQFSPLATTAAGSALQLDVADIRLSHQPRLAGIKHLNRLEQTLAAAEREGLDCDDLLVLDQADAVISLIAANLICVIDGCLYTPELQRCGIVGTRLTLLADRIAPQLGLSLVWRTLSLQEVLSAEEVFACNSLQGYRPVGQLQQQRWSIHPVCTAVQQHYDALN